MTGKEDLKYIKNRNIVTDKFISKINELQINISIYFYRFFQNGVIINELDNFSD